MTLQILTLTWQGKDKMQALQKSLMPALVDIDYKWWVKENGSSDGSVEEIRNWNNPGINMIVYPHNRDNYGKGMNLLFKEAAPKDDDIILTLNNDVIINDSMSIKNMIKILKEDNTAGIVGAKLNYTDSDKLQHCGVLFHRNNGLPYHYRAGISEQPRDRTNRYYPVVTGAVAMMRADTYANCYRKNKSGMHGFNEDYFFAFEDVDMCMRSMCHLKKANVYCGQTGIFHEESATLKKNPVHKMFFGANCKLFLDTWHKQINISLDDKYKDDGYNVYTGGIK